MDEYLLIPIIIMALAASFLFRNYAGSSIAGIIIRIALASYDDDFLF